MKHRIVTAAQMKEIERAGNAHGLPYLQMMENAGLAAYTQLRARLPQGGALLIVCGKGNTGGDGHVMARAAAQDGWRVAVLLAEGDLKTPDAMTNYARLADLPVTKCRDAATLAAQPFDAVVWHRVSRQPSPGRAGCLCADESSAGKRRIRAGRRSARRHQHRYG